MISKSKDLNVTISITDKSNRTDKVFKVYIPYENIEETNQWGENLKVDLDIIIL